MDEVSPLLGNRLQESPEVLSPNLRPRHQDLLPTPCGPMKRWSELTLTARIYFCLIMVSLLVLFGLTVPTYQQRTDPHLYNEDFAVSIIQLMGVLFCIYYISRGVLQENKLELVVFVLSLLVVMVRSLINFIVVGPEGRKELLARFVCIMLLGVFHIFGTIFFFLWSPNTMAFRVGGALESVQEHYFLSNICFSMVTFDLQAQLCLCILITASDGGMSATYTAVLAVGVAWACLTAAVGAIAVLKEAKGLVWIFMVQNLLQLAFCGYLTYTVVKRWFTDQTYTNEAAAVSGSLLSLVIKAVLLWGLVKLLRSFRH
ncbi:hypothetical protein FQA47_005166 [Oryzias melastigma]|uniref:Uncharacterized LOC112138538 n=2 Tax=Oryzias melastigma TaxID=30732 RepID=A0A3B3BN52_ORYME|nr:uncharacterized protein LOC112138538 isoform X1 [Oryzias melastigma]XP_036069973.1 uncharacterized protein LOC112138538 isoform X1 [Oryzias melastigma]KAF6719776.1 hypothetical protein FQA47_005166 [Oryzias melastigma]